MTRFKLYNTVWYDGTDAWVSKFILPTDSRESLHEIAYIRDTYDGDLLKVDEIGDIEFKDILKLKNDTDAQYRLAYKRFEDMMNRI